MSIAAKVRLDVSRSILEHWRENPYYERAELDDWLLPFWGEQSPFLRLFQRLDASCLVELACGRGRHTAHILADDRLAKPGSIVLMDANAENIEQCRKRFASRPEMQCRQNNGVDFRPLPDFSATAIFCYDAMVHFEYDCVLSYVQDAFRVLRGGGQALLHHSNYANPGSHWNDNPHSRNFMSRELMSHAAQRTGFEVVEQIVMDWGEDWNLAPGLDCLTLLRKPDCERPPPRFSVMSSLRGLRPLLRRRSP